MKSKREILIKIDDLKHDLEIRKEKYNNLGQIEMVCGNGDDQRLYIEYIKGQIQALKWSIDELH